MSSDGLRWEADTRMTRSSHSFPEIFPDRAFAGGARIGTADLRSWVAAGVRARPDLELVRITVVIDSVPAVARSGRQQLREHRTHRVRLDAGTSPPSGTRYFPKGCRISPGRLVPTRSPWGTWHPPAIPCRIGGITVRDHDLRTADRDGTVLDHDRTALASCPAPHLEREVPTQQD